MIERQGAHRRAVLVAVWTALVGVAGCGGGAKDLHATFTYPMLGCFPLSVCTTSPTVSGLEGHAPTFQVAPGTSLPSWATLDPATGVVSGVPLAAESPDNWIDMTVAGYQGKLTALLLVTVDPLVFRLCYDNVDFSDRVGSPVEPIHACVGGPGYTGPLAPGVSQAYSLTAGSLPPGVALDAATGRLSGTPSAPGRFDFEVTMHLEYGATSYTQSDTGAFAVSP